MNWLFPEILWSLFAIAIPIAIHLFNLKRFKTLYFSNIQWLKKISLQTKKQSQIKKMLLLLTRIFIFIFLIFAFSQPYIPLMKHEKLKHKKYITIYIDNSFSMDMQVENGIAFDVAKEYAYTLIESYGNKYKFQILSNNFTSSSQFWLNSKDAIFKVGQIKRSPYSKSFSEIYEYSDEAFINIDSKNKQHILYYVSDFQKSTTKIEELKVDSSKIVFFIPLNPNKFTNISIDSVWFESPINRSSINKLKARFKNYKSKNTATVGVELFVNEKSKGIKNIIVSPENYSDSTFYYFHSKEKEYNIKLKIRDFPIIYDNEFFVSYKIPESIKILEIFESFSNKYLKKLYTSDSIFKFKTMNIDYINLSELNEQNTIILSNISKLKNGLKQNLIEFVKNGGNIIVFPKFNEANLKYEFPMNEIQKLNYISIENTSFEINKLDKQTKLYKNVFKSQPKNMNMPVVNQYIKTFQSIQSKSEAILKLNNEDPILYVTPFEKGKIYQFTIAITEQSSSFPKHYLFVPTMLNIALNQSLSTPISYFIRDNQFIKINAAKENLSNEKIYHVSLTKNKEKSDVILQYQLIQNIPSLKLNENIQEQGFYSIQNHEQKKVQNIALNYDRIESSPEIYENEELKNMISNHKINVKILNNSFENIEKLFINLKEGISLWKWMIGLTIIFIILENIILIYTK